MRTKRDDESIMTLRLDGGTRTARRWPLVAVAVALVAWGANQFAPMLLVYRDQLGISAATAQATFALYAIGLVPGLLLGGPLSDRRGRRPVLAAALIASVLASSLLLTGGSSIAWVFAGRLLAGVASGAAFSAGSAWIKELAPADLPGVGARRATVAMTAGFAAGPLVAGVLAEWAPAPTVVPYVPHLVLAAAAAPLVLLAPETVTGRPSVVRRFSELRNPRFQHVVAPLAPWVFGAAAIPLAYLPGVVQHRVGHAALVFGAAVAALTALAGIAIQPLARRVDGPDRPRLLTGALALVVAGMLIAAGASAERSPTLVVVAALVLGAAYGALQVCGLLEVQRLAPPTALAGMTAVYQALSYLGFALPYVLAAVAGTLAPATGLLIVAGAAALTLAVTARAARSERYAPLPMPPHGRPA